MASALMTGAMFVMSPYRSILSKGVLVDNEFRVTARTRTGADFDDEVGRRDWKLF